MTHYKFFTIITYFTFFLFSFLAGGVVSSFCVSSFLLSANKSSSSSSSNKPPPAPLVSMVIKRDKKLVKDKESNVDVVGIYLYTLFWSEYTTQSQNLYLTFYSVQATSSSNI